MEGDVSREYRPTMHLRYREEGLDFSQARIKINWVLEQMWQGDNGNVEWRKIEYVKAFEAKNGSG